MNLGFHTSVSIGVARVARTANDLANLLANTTDRRQMCVRGRELLDDQGADRVVAAIDRQTNKLAL